MRNHGWLWASENALDAYKLILINSAFCDGGFATSEQLSSLIDLADEIARLEGRIPDSFRVAVDLGTIYSAAAVSNAHDITISNEFIAKADEAWSIASSHLDNGMLRDAALVEPGPLRAHYVGGYFQIPCEINFARYLQSNCNDVSHLRASKKYWVRAKQERPDHPVLLTVGEHVAKNISPAEQTEEIQYRSPAFLPRPERSELKPAGQGRLGVRIGAGIGAVVIVVATLSGLAYVYVPLERAREPQHDAEASSPRSSSDWGISVSPQTAVATSAGQPQAIEPSRDKESETIAHAEEPAETTSTLQEPIKQQQDEKSSRKVAGQQQRAAALDESPQTAKQNVASIDASKGQARSRDVKKAADLERQGLQALVAGHYTEAQRLFQASDEAANGFHYSQEWARLLRTYQAELKTIDGRKSVLQYALSKGYASHAPNDIRDNLRHLAQ